MSIRSLSSFAALVSVALTGLVACQKVEVGPHADVNPHVAPVTPVAPGLRCREKFRPSDLRGVRLAPPGARAYLEIEDGSYEAEQVAVMYSVNGNTGPADFLFSHAINPTAWRGTDPVSATLPPGDFDHYFAHDGWRDFDTTRFRHRIGHTVDLPLSLSKQGAGLQFREPIGFQVRFSHQEREQRILMSRGPLAAGVPLLFTEPMLMGNHFYYQGYDEGRNYVHGWHPRGFGGPRHNWLVHQQPFRYGIERKNGYFKFTAHYRQARLYGNVECTTTCGPIVRDQVVDVWVQIFYARTR